MGHFRVMREVLQKYERNCGGDCLRDSYAFCGCRNIEHKFFEFLNILTNVEKGVLNAKYV